MEEMNSYYAKALLDKVKEIESGLKYYIDRVNSLENENKVLLQMYENRVEQSLQQKTIGGDKQMTKYICVNEKEDIALYYLKSLGKRRIYRQAYPLKPLYFENDFGGEDLTKGLKLYEYKRKENAQKLCDDINSRQDIKFVVKEVE